MWLNKINLVKAFDITKSEFLTDWSQLVLMSQSSAEKYRFRLEPDGCVTLCQGF